MIPPVRPDSPRARSLGRPGRRFRGFALAALLTASLPLCGCGASLFGHRIPLLDRRSAPRETGLAAEIRGIREQAAFSPAEPYWPFRLGEVYLAADSLTLAEASLEEALRRDRSYAPALALLSKRYFVTGRHAQAIRMLEAVREGTGDAAGELSPALLAGLALHYDALERSDRASDLISAIRSPATGAIGTTAVYLRLRGSDPDSAAGLAVAVVREHPGDAASQNNYGITRLRAGDPISARRAFLEAIERNPGLPGPYYNLAILEKYFAFDGPAAARWFRLYRERDDDDPDGLAASMDGSPSKPAGEEGHTP